MIGKIGSWLVAVSIGTVGAINVYKTGSDLGLIQMGIAVIILDLSEKQ